MKAILFSSAALGLLMFSACGPTARGNIGGDDDGNGNDGGSGSGSQDYNCTPSGDENTPATCSDNIDQDCDGLVDCADPSCSGIGQCPVCGQVQHPVSGGLPLPDGVGDTSCSTPGTQGSCPSTQLCWNAVTDGDLCRLPYTSKLNFTGFGPNQVITDVSNIQSICVNMEHSWMRDLDIQLVAPSGQVLELLKFAGTGTVVEDYLGIANDCDDDDTPVPGTGSDYCWTPTATNPNMTTYINGSSPMNSVTNCLGDTSKSLPPGNYAAAGAFTGLVGATLNGDWELRVADLWPIDNGYIFKWSLSFDPTIVQDCSGPVIQ